MQPHAFKQNDGDKSAPRNAEQLRTAQLRLTLTVTETAALLGISRGLAYEAVRRGEIPSIRIGRRTLVPRTLLVELLNGAHENEDNPLRGLQSDGAQ